MGGDIKCTDVKLQFCHSMTVSCAEDVLKLDLQVPVMGRESGSLLMLVKGEDFLDCRHTFFFSLHLYLIHKP